MPVILDEPITERKPEMKSTSDGCDFPPPFGRCPQCQAPLRPRDRYTDEPRMPPINAGRDSRAKCDRCGALIQYVGKGEWVIWDGKGEVDESA